MLCSHHAAVVSRPRWANRSHAKTAAAGDPRRFGRGRSWTVENDESRSRVSDDLRLFATTFAGGFLFVSLLIA